MGSSPVTITDTNLIPYTSAITGLKFGDINAAGHWIRIKNLYAVA